MDQSDVISRLIKLGWDTSIYMVVWRKIRANHVLTPDEIASANHLHEKGLVSMTRTPIWSDKGIYKGMKVSFGIGTKLFFEPKIKA